MSYLFCEKCWGYYQLQPGESREDFESCRCGGTLIEVDSLEELFDSLESKVAENSLSKSDIQRMEFNEDIDGLIHVLKSENPKLRSYAATSLGRLKDEKSFEHLLAVINDKNWKVRANSIVALSKFKDRNKFLEIILPEINDKKHRVREAVIMAFENIGGDIAFENIVKGLNDKHYVVRRRAAVALGKLGDKRAIEYLIPALDDNHQMVRFKVAGAIRKIEDEKTAATIIGFKGEERVNRWLDQLDDEFTIFSNVLIPGCWGGNIDHVVLGENGIFVIETKNFNIPYILEDNEWYYRKNKELKKAPKNPTKQLKANVTFLGQYLRSNDIFIANKFIIPILAYVNTEKLTIKKEPNDYHIMKPKEIPEFILNNENEIDDYILKRSIEMIKPFIQNEYYQPK